MKFLAKILCVTVAIAVTALNFSCKPKGTAVDLYYFNSPIHIETHGKILDSGDLEWIKSYLSELESEFDLSKENSTLSKFNSASANEEIQLSKNVNEVFSIAKLAHEFSDGKFNPAVYPLIKLWQFSSGYPVKEFTPPTQADISKILDGGLVDFDKVILDNNTAIKTTDGIEIDFGGIVKGYAADEIGKFLTSNGYDKGYLSVGSSSLFIMQTENLSIRHPRPTEDLTGIIKVNLNGDKNLGVSTSGDYERYYTHQGKTYSHLIDGKIGYPTQTGVASATVIGADGAFSDAITTALCLCNHDTSQTDSELISLVEKIIQEYPSAGVFVIYSNGIDKQVITNKTADEDFTLLDESYTIVKI